jgi:chromosome partitioning protein
MPVIAVVNRKGGSGKSTLAAHIAAWCARQGHSVMLGDVDRQQSSRTWLKRRDPALPAVAPWAMDQKNVLRVPTGITHVVLDTPGGLHGFELARVVMFADAIIMPVCHSVFDRESAAACHAELMALPRVASGRCRLATVGMRIDGRTSAGQVLRDWSDGLGLPFLGVLRETQVYVRCLERGLTIFDLTPSQAATDLAQWRPSWNG